MKKQEMIDYIGKHLDWFECMQTGLGHHSWWYTNRTPEECINVKLHAYADVDKVEEMLTEQEQTALQVLNIDLNEYLSDLIWGDFGMVEMARDELLDELTSEYNVTELEYGGRSGGWLAVVYEWDSVPEDYDTEYSAQEVRAFYQTIKKALEEHEKVTALVLQRKRELEKCIEDPENYIGQVREMVSSRLDSEKEHARDVLEMVVA